MADTVQISNEIQYYKWSDCTFPWADGRCNKSFNMFGYAHYTISVVESVNMLESHKKSIIQGTHKESLKVSESFTRKTSFIRNILEVIKLSDKIIMSGKFTKIISESIHIDESNKFNIAKSIFENFIIKELVAKNSTISKSEALSISETYWDNILFFLHVVESFSISDKVSKGITSMRKDNISVRDNISKNAITFQKELLSFADSINKNIVSNQTDNISLHDNLSKLITTNKQEKLSLIDSINKNILSNQREDILLKDNVSKDIEIIKESLFSLSDSMNKAISSNTKECISIDEKLFKEIKVNKAETLQIFDELKRELVFTREFLEGISVNDHLTKDISHSEREAFAMSDFIYKSFNLVKNENMSVEDSFNRSLNFVRNFDEDFKITEQMMKEYSLNKSEMIGIVDAFIRACNAVLSDVNISSEEMTLDDFLKVVKTPPGFNAFTEFNVGDYEYQEALVRLVIEVAATQSEPFISGVAHHVDIDDVVCKGVETITNTESATKIYFDKHYYTPPFVQVTLKGGSTSESGVYPNIISTDQKDENGRYFEVELLNASGNRTTGVISWNSTGY